MYLGALDSLTAEMEPLSAAELAHINNEVPTFGARLRHLPFSKLRSSRTHRFGSLRAYLRAISFDSIVDWSSLKWRPLISFPKHTWRVILSLTSRF